MAYPLEQGLKYNINSTGIRIVAFSLKGLYLMRLSVAILQRSRLAGHARPTGLIAAKIRAQRDLLDHAYFDSHCSRVNKALREAFCLPSWRNNSGQRQPHRRLPQ